MKRYNRGSVDPYGISLLFAIIGAVFFENYQEEAQHVQQEQPQYNQASAHTVPATVPEVPHAAGE